MTQSGYTASPGGLPSSGQDPPRRPRRAAAVVLAFAVALAACTSAGRLHRTRAAESPPAVRTTTSSDPRTGCLQAVLHRLSPAQQVGQLFMVGVPTDASPDAARASAVAVDAGGVLLYGGGGMSAAAVGALTSSLQAGSPLATQGVALYVAADQEGGSVQELSGSGFTAMPPAIVQGRTPPRSLLSEASGWAGQWARSGLNLDLAPVADVVPADQVRTNQVDGIYGRELGSDPVAVAGDVAALVQGLQSAGVGATLKHFPGLGRVTDNTDTAPGVTDTKTSARDPDLGSFTAGIAAGARFVMVSLARYDLIDPTQPAVYSPVVITQLLRHSLGFGGVVISDDLGAAASAQSLPVGERAAAFIRAGGDIALVVGPASSVAPMVQGLEAAAANDPGLQAQIGTAVRKVLTDKIRAGLISC